MNNEKNCNYKDGSLPGTCAPLAVAFIPFQMDAEKVYSSGDALSRGTLFPGLDLPFMGHVNTAAAGNTPMAELMALGFAADDLGLYLDTHPEDSEAFELYCEYMRLFNVGRKKYVEMYGPLSKSDTVDIGKFTWLKDPWPWNTSERRGV